jgi:REase_DpnII-MboI/Uncharacterized protein conserved in bacteria (DUF2321)
MHAVEDPVQDVMQVCRHGHVITDLLHSRPERALTHCDRCGAVTMDRCLTCGRELTGAIVVPGFQPVGVRRPPLYCSACGVAFPWTERPRTLAPESLTHLETLLHRLPRVIRELRFRHGDRPPFRVQDERDLEDLLRSLLPLHFDDIRPQCRTPRYAAFTRTDFLLASERIAVTAKFARLDLREPQLAEQLYEDAVYYRSQGGCRTLVGFVYDPEGLLREPSALAACCASTDDDLKVRLILPLAA